MGVTATPAFFAGLVLLVLGAEALVRGAVRIAAALRIPPVVAGLTVVAFGTSAPEMAVSIRAGVDGLGGIALGNVLGSNIFNVLVILGLAAIVRPLAVHERLVRLDLPVMVAAGVLFFGVAAGGTVGQGEGLALVALLVLYTSVLVRKRVAAPDGAEAVPASAARIAPAALFVFAGLGMLLLGSRWLVEGAIGIARAAGVSNRIVGLTVVAAGTSLPELATSIVAAFRGQRDIAVGNVVGSNVFNLLGVLGLAAAVAPGGIPVPRASLLVDGSVMLGASLVCLPVFFTGRTISRWEGALLLAGFAVYSWFLWSAPAT